MKKFNPMIFLASLGAGGVAVMPFALMQYTIKHPAGLIKIADIFNLGLSGLDWIYYLILFAIMIIFTIIHFVLTIILLKKLFIWIKNKYIYDYLDDTINSVGILTPLLSLAMSMNVFVGPVRFFIPTLSDNLQVFMLPALMFWLLLMILTMIVEIKYLKSIFLKGLQIEKIDFSWLLPSFTLGMISVVGFGIAALSISHTISNIATFFSLISMSFGLFLMIIKTNTIFKNRLHKPKEFSQQFLPGFLILIPNITLYAISIFRFGHYLEHTYNMDARAFIFITVVGGFAFQMWYLVLGLSLGKDYFTQYILKNKFTSNQWGLICPFVAIAVLGSFVYKLFGGSSIVYLISILTGISAIVFYIILTYWQFKNHNNLKGNLD